MSPQYGELRPTSGWDQFTSLRHPCKFRRLLRLGSVTARQTSSGREPNFAALNRGRHLCSVGRPSRWALAHILVTFCICCHVFTFLTFYYCLKTFLHLCLLINMHDAVREILNKHNIFLTFKPLVSAAHCWLCVLLTHCFLFHLLSWYLYFCHK